jgi:glucan phosphorylase
MSEKPATRGNVIEHDADSERARVAYFLMEVALENRIPTYSGRLGVLADDTLRSATGSFPSTRTRSMDGRS